MSDVVIIGEGPAGIAMAISLQNGGIRPLVVERARRPRRPALIRFVGKQSLRVAKKIASA